MNRAIKDATVKRTHDNSHDQLRDHLQLFVDAYHHARRLKTLERIPTKWIPVRRENARENKGLEPPA